MKNEDSQIANLTFKMKKKKEKKVTGWIPLPNITAYYRAMTIKKLYGAGVQI